MYKHKVLDLWKACYRTKNSICIFSVMLFSTYFYSVPFFLELWLLFQWSLWPQICNGKGMELSTLPLHFKMFWELVLAMHFCFRCSERQDNLIFVILFALTVVQFLVLMLYGKFMRRQLEKRKSDQKMC